MNKIFPRGQSRLFASVWFATLIVDAFHVSAISVHEPVNFDRLNATMAMECFSFPYSILIPVIQPIKATAQNVRAEGVILNIVDSTTVRAPEGSKTHYIDAFPFIQHRLLQMVYLLFYEQHRPYIQSLHGGDTKKWPQIFQFAWLLRNGIAHHGGNLNFTNSNYPAVSWHTLSYSPADNGKPIFNDRFGPGDFFMFLFDLSDALDAAGAPMPID
jgi:hypothetical protein